MENVETEVDKSLKALKNQGLTIGPSHVSAHGECVYSIASLKRSASRACTISRNWSLVGLPGAPRLDVIAIIFRPFWLLRFEGLKLGRPQLVCKNHVFLQRPIVYGKQPSRRSESILRTQRHIRGPRGRGHGSRIPLDRSHVELHLATGVYLPLWGRRLNRRRLTFGRLSAQ